LIISLLDCFRILEMGGTFDPGLSGGERKRATIACELIANPKVLILDVSWPFLSSNRTL